MEFDCSSTISASFTHYENGANDAISTNAPFVLRSMVIIPSTLNTLFDGLDANAHQFMRFNLVDVDFRHVFYCSERNNIHYLVGLRYAGLEQTFATQFGVLGEDNVDTRLNFDGGGIRLGLEGERTASCCNLFVYGKASASFLGGEFQGNYQQTGTFVPGSIAETDWKEARLVSILECEVGLGWTGCNDHVRVSGGYMVNGWMNVVKTPEFISAVQNNQFHGSEKIDGNALVFDGFVTRLELRW